MVILRKLIIKAKKLNERMIIVNSKTTPSCQTLSNPQPFTTGYSSRKQFESIKQLQNEEENSILEWIRQNFHNQYSHCKRIHAIQDLFDGIALAEIVSSFLTDQNQKEDFLNEIELVQKLESKNGLKAATKNLDLVIEVVKQMFNLVYGNSQLLVKKNKNNVNLIKLVQILIKSLESYNGESLVNSKSKMKNFMIQIIMILPEISITLQEPNISKHSKGQKQNQKPLRTETNTKKRTQSEIQYRTESKYNNFGHQNQYSSSSYNYNNIEELSSIIGYSTVNNHEKTSFTNVKINPVQSKNSHENQYKSEESDQNYNVHQTEAIFQSNQNEIKFQAKVQKLLTWIQGAYNIDISQLMEPHLLLGELVNSIMAPSRLKDNQKPIKPTHYQLGSYSAYKKVLNILSELERLNKSNLISLMKQVEAGKVNETTYWNLIEDIYFMIKNRVSQPMSSRRRQSKPKSVKKATQQSQKVLTEYDQNINIDNIRNQSVTELLKLKQDPNKPKTIKDHPLYPEQVIKQTQLWLQNQMGMGHPLSKSKPTAKTSIFENPLLNGTIFAKIIQRLKIGPAKGTLTPENQKQLKNNLEIIKTEFLNRGYEAIRKIDIFKPSYNFYIGLFSQIREIHMNKQSNTKKQLMDDKQKRQIEEAQSEIPSTERQELEKWLLEEYKESLQQVNGIKQVSLKQMKVVIESIVKANFLKETTEKIRLLNYIKLLEFFRSIGFAHYSLVRVEDVVSQNAASNKKSQNLRWMILRDLKIIKGN